MQFMLILAEDPDLVATDDDRQAAVQSVGEFAMGLVGDGVLKGGAPLHPVREARKVRTRAGRQRVFDGPFAESKEVIAGYFIIEAPDMGSCRWDERVPATRRAVAGRRRDVAAPGRARRGRPDRLARAASQVGPAAGVRAAARLDHGAAGVPDHPGQRARGGGPARGGVGRRSGYRVTVLRLSTAGQAGDRR